MFMWTHGPFSSAEQIWKCIQIKRQNEITLESATTTLNDHLHFIPFPFSFVDAFLWYFSIFPKTKTHHYRKRKPVSTQVKKCCSVSLHALSQYQCPTTSSTFQLFCYRKQEWLFFVCVVFIFESSSILKDKLSLFSCSRCTAFFYSVHRISLHFSTLHNTTLCLHFFPLRLLLFHHIRYYVSSVRPPFILRSAVPTAAQQKNVVMFCVSPDRNKWQTGRDHPQTVIYFTLHKTSHTKVVALCKRGPFRPIPIRKFPSVFNLLTIANSLRIR